MNLKQKLIKFLAVIFIAMVIVTTFASLSNAAEESLEEILERGIEEAEKSGMTRTNKIVPFDTLYGNTKMNNFNVMKYFASKDLVGSTTIPSSYILLSSDTNQNGSSDSKDISVEQYGNIPIHWENQGSYGLCWAFTSLNTLETNLSLKNKGTYDFSELHLDYLSYINNYCFNRSLHQGGRFEIFEGYVDSNDGPVLEEEVPYANTYNSAEEIEELENLDAKVSVDDLIYFPTIDKYNNIYYLDEENYAPLTSSMVTTFRNQVKEHIMENGAVYATIDSSNGMKVNSTLNVLVQYGTTYNIDHAVTIIGWDDNFAKENFSVTGHTPSQDGAYIALNSWYGNYHDIFYISYEDTMVEYEMSGIVDATVLNPYKIEVTKNPDKIDYIAGETFDPTGMEITVTYLDGSQEVISNYDYNKDALTSSDKEIEISYAIGSAKVSTGIDIAVYSQIANIDGVIFDYNEENKWLKVTGSGNIPAYSAGSAPWDSLDVEFIEIDEGITSIESNAFASLENLVNVYILGNEVEIGENAFYYNGSVLLYVYNDVYYTIFADEMSSYINYSNYYKVNNYMFCLVDVDGGIFNISGIGNMDANTVTSNMISEIGDSIFYIYADNYVTGLGDGIFENLENLEEVYLGDKFENIGNETFKNCKNLYVFEPVNYLKSIGNAAFYGCENIDSFNLDGVTSLGYSAFENCTNLQELSFPSTINEIPQAVCKNCVLLSSLTIAEEIENIKAEAFYGCESLSNIEISKNVEEIYEGAFENCTLLSDVVIKGSTILDDACFKGCSSLSTISFEDNSINHIGAQAFENCSSLESIDLPSKITSIEDELFYGCSSLQEVDIPTSVTSIGKDVFTGCSSLSKVRVGFGTIEMDTSTYSSNATIIIPLSLETLNLDTSYSNLNVITAYGSVADVNASSFGSVQYDEDNPYIDNVEFITEENGVRLIVSANDSFSGLAYDAYSFDDGKTWQEDNNELITKTSTVTIQVRDSVGNINSISEKVTIEGTSSDEDIQLGENIYANIDSDNGIIEVVGSGSMYDTFTEDTAPLKSYNEIETVNIGSGITDIGKYVFADMTGLKQVNIGDDVKDINEGAFYGITTLTSFNFPSSLETIGKNAIGFYDSSITEIELPSTLTSYDVNAIYNHTNITKVTVACNLPVLTNVEENFSDLTLTLKHNNVTKIERVEATCDTEGNIEYYKCSDCNKLYSDSTLTNEITEADTILNKTAHNLVKVEQVDATCSEEGMLSHYKCSICGKLFSDKDGANVITESDLVIAKTAHSMQKTSKVDATCTENGNIEYYTCTKCGNKFSDEKGTTSITDVTISALGHNLSKHEATVLNCLQGGNMEYYECLRCGKLYLDENATEETTSDGIKVAGKHTLEKVEAKDATCTEDGNVAYYKCSVCNLMFKDSNGSEQITDVTVKATGHTMQKTARVEATCTQAGNTEYYTCAKCNKLFNDQTGSTEITKESTVIAPTGHTMQKTARVEATCTTAGNIEYYTCTKCGNKFSDEKGTTSVTDVTIQALGHNMQKTAAKDSTCTEVGNIEYYTCSRCNKIFRDSNGTNEITINDTVVSLKAHTLIKHDAKKATSTENGNIEYYECSVCHKLFSDSEGKNEITKSDIYTTFEHNLVKVEAVAATCTEDGSIAYYKCTDCNKLYKDSDANTELTANDIVVKALGHNLVKTDRVEATCLEAGNTEYYTCSRCNRIFSDSKSANEITINDTVINPLGHTMQKVDMKDSTCTEEGNIEYYLCTRCNKSYNDNVGTIELSQSDIVISKKAHDLEKHEGYDATCTEKGMITYYTCRTCGDGFYDAEGKEEIGLNSVYIDELGHSLVKTEVKEPTCIENGNTKYYTCSRCNKIFNSEDAQVEITIADTVVNALGHNVEKIEAKDPTCTEDGNIEHFECTRCKEIYQDQEGSIVLSYEDIAVKALGHILVKTEKVDATCLEAGNIEYYTCTRCNKVYTTEEATTEITVEETVVNALGHSLVKTEAKDPTCLEAGNTEYYTCSRCNKVYTTEEATTEITIEETVVNALGHNLVKVEAKDATCLEDGNIEYYNCLNCNKKYTSEDATEEITEDVTIKALGHNIEKVDAVDATCTEDGNVEYYICTRCNNIYLDEALTVSVEKEEVVVAKLGHDLKTINYVAPTCTEEGNIKYVVCSRCNKMFDAEDNTKELTQEETKVAATGHKFIHHEAKKATAKEAGNIEYYECENCGKYYTDETAEKEIKLEDTIIAQRGILEKHVDLNSEKVLAYEYHDGEPGDAYEIKSKEFDGYVLVKDSGNTKGEMTDKLIVVTYYYAREAKVIIKYVDRNTNEVLTKFDITKGENVEYVEEIEGYEGKTYEVEAKQIENYNIVTSDFEKIKTGKMKVTENEDGTINSTSIIYVNYAHTSEGVKVQCIDVDNKEVLKEYLISGSEGDTYRVDPVSIANYNFVTGQSIIEGKMTQGLIEVTYYYTKAPVTTNSSSNNSSSNINSGSGTRVITVTTANTSKADASEDSVPYTGDEVYDYVYTIYIVIFINLVVGLAYKLIFKNGKIYW